MEAAVVLELAVVLRELMEAARRGVSVRVLVDSFGAEKDSETLAHLTSYHSDLKIKIYRPARDRLDVAIWPLIQDSLLRMKSINQRMHNKLIVVDGEVAVTGGRNFEDTYFDNSIGIPIPSGYACRRYRSAPSDGEQRNARTDHRDL